MQKIYTTSYSIISFLTITFVILILECEIGYGQNFLNPYEKGLPLSRNCEILTFNGEQFKGTLIHAVTGTRGIKSITLEVSEFGIRQMKASDILELRFENDEMVKINASIDRFKSLKKIVKTDWETILHVDQIIYKSALLPSGKKRILMQIINPNFANRIEVYFSPGSRKTSGLKIPNFLHKSVGSNGEIRLTGDLERAYWVSKDKSEIFKIKKGNYTKRKFNTLFGDCSDMVEKHSRPFRIKDFSKHVYEYEQCNN